MTELLEREMEMVSSTLAEDLLGRMDETIEGLWATARGGAFWKGVVEGEHMSRDLYRVLMVQVYHYTRHNSTNQAVAAFKADPGEIGLLRFVYGHADEELGHEMMVLHDLRAIGLLGRDEPITDVPLPATEALINYLYGVALREGPVARLGYSYWAESVYGHIAPVLLQARRSLQLTDDEMAFFVAHSEIDAKHAAAVAEMIRRWVRTPEQAQAVLQVLRTTLWLTLGLIEQAYDFWLATQ